MLLISALHQRQNMTNSQPEINKIIKQSSLIKDGTPTRHSLKLRTDPVHESEPYRKISFGERNRQKLLKNILVMGETGTATGKNNPDQYNDQLHVQREDKVWIENTDDQSN